MAEVGSDLWRSPSTSILLCNNFLNDKWLEKYRAGKERERNAHPAVAHCTLVADQVSMNFAHCTTLRQQKEILKDNQTHNYTNWHCMTVFVMEWSPT